MESTPTARPKLTGKTSPLPSEINVDDWLEEDKVDNKSYPDESRELVIGDIDDKRFKVNGKGTLYSRTTLRNLGGKSIKFPPHGPGFMFFNQCRTKVEEWVNGIMSRETNPDFATPFVRTKEQYHTDVSGYQMVPSYKVQKPNKGMNVNVASADELGDYTISSKITRVKDINGIITEAFFDYKNVERRLVVVNGKWQVWAHQKDHKVFFTR